MITFKMMHCYFDVELTEGRPIDGTGEINYTEVKVKRINGTTYAGSGILKVNEDIGNDYQVTFHISSLNSINLIFQHYVDYDKFL